MRNILLTIAIALAACINGILAYDLSLCGNREIAVSEAPKIRIEAPVPAIKVPETVATEGVTDIEVLIVQPPVVRCYPKWEYRPFQPVRNLVRFFHNRKPVRSWLFGRYC
jgi:hypothetical protein